MGDLSPNLWDRSHALVMDMLFCLQLVVSPQRPVGKSARNLLVCLSICLFLLFVSLFICRHKANQ